MRPITETSEKVTFLVPDEVEEQLLGGHVTGGGRVVRGRLREVAVAALGGRRDDHPRCEPLGQSQRLSHVGHQWRSKRPSSRQKRPRQGPVCEVKQTNNRSTISSFCISRSHRRTQTRWLAGWLLGLWSRPAPADHVLLHLRAAGGWTTSSVGWKKMRGLRWNIGLNRRIAF